MQSRSCSVKLISSVVKKPLLRMLRCDRVAPLGRPVVPEVYWMLIGSPGSQARQSLRDRLGRHRFALAHQVRPVVGVEVDHAAQARTLVAHLLDHRAVVAGLEARRRDQQRQAALVDGVGELVGAVGRVDVDQDRPDLRGGVLDQRPLRAVRRPDPDPVALLDPGRDQAAGQRVDVGVELGPGPPPAAGHLDQRLAVGVRRHRALEVGADRLLEQRRAGLPVRTTPCAPT